MNHMKKNRNIFKYATSGIITGIFLVFMFSAILIYSENAMSSKINLSVRADHKNTHPSQPVNVIVPVLLYHHFDPDIKPDLYNTTVTPSEFEEQLDYFLTNGYHSIFFDDLYNYINNKGNLPSKPFILTIDDGYESNYAIAFPLLKKYRTKATIFIVASSVGKTPGRFAHFTWEQAKEMEKSGLVEIQNHGFYHKNHDMMTDDELKQSVSKAQQEIEKNLGKRALKIFSYPEGYHSERTKLILENLGFKIQMTGLNDLLYTSSTKLNSVKRINIEHGMKGTDIEQKIRYLMEKKQ